MPTSEKWEVHRCRDRWIVVSADQKKVVAALYTVEAAAWLRAALGNIQPFEPLASYTWEAKWRDTAETWVIKRFGYREEPSVHDPSTWPTWQEWREPVGLESTISACKATRYEDDPERYQGAVYALERIAGLLYGGRIKEESA